MKKYKVTCVITYDIEASNITQAQKLAKSMLKQKIRVQEPLISVCPTLEELTVCFEYHDAANYKYYLDKDMSEVVAVLGRPPQIGDTIPYEQLGYTTKEFHKNIVCYPHDPDIDHNILRVVALK